MHQAEETIGEAERVLLDDVRDSVGDLVAVMQAWKSKNAISKVFTSTLCKRRQEEAEDAIKEAVSRLQVRKEEVHSVYSLIRKKKKPNVTISLHGQRLSCAPLL